MDGFCQIPGLNIRHLNLWLIIFLLHHVFVAATMNLSGSTSIISDYQYFLIFLSACEPVLSQIVLCSA